MKHCVIQLRMIIGHKVGIIISDHDSLVERFGFPVFLEKSLDGKIQYQWTIVFENAEIATITHSSIQAENEFSLIATDEVVTYSFRKAFEDIILWKI